MKRITTVLAVLVAVLALAAAPAQASRRAEGSRHRVTPRAAATWTQPPTNLDTFSNIWGAKSTGFTADHWNDDYGYWANTLYPPRHDMLFGYCPRATKTAAAEFACQTAWDAFYTFLQENRLGPFPNGYPLP